MRTLYVRCNPMYPGLQPLYPRLHPMYPRLQPYVAGAATPRARYSPEAGPVSEAGFYP